MPADPLASPTTNHAAPAPASPAAARVLADISFLLARAFYSFRGLLERLLADAGIDDRVRPGMGPILHALYSGDNCTIKDIARLTRLSPSTLTGALARMEKHGLTRQRTDRKDRRAVRVRLTPLGRSLQPKLLALHRRVMAVLRAGMTDLEIQETRQRLGRMIDAMKTHEKDWRDARRNARSAATGRRERRSK